MNKPQLVQHFMDQHACHSAAWIAVTDGQDRLTYGELEELSNQLAHCLKEHGVMRQDRVVFCMQRSVHCLTAVLGILKADAVYVPLDPKTPEQRRRMIIADCQPRAILCDRTTSNQPDLVALAREGVRTFVLDPKHSTLEADGTGSAGWPDILRCNKQRLDCLNRSDDLAYVMYTSGSTGQPKGVMISHRNIWSYIDWAVDRFELNTADKILSTAPFHFDMSTFDVHSTLKAGGTLCIANDMMTLFPEMLVRYIEKQGVTVWKGVSSLLMYMARSGVLGPERMPSLKTVLFAGESLPARYLMQWMKAYPEKIFVNAYGPTEATGVSLYYQIDKAPSSTQERVPIGKPCKDTEVFLIKDDMSVADVGEVGELCIAGPCLARGYLNDPLKTAQSFIESDTGSGIRQRYYRTGDLAKLRNDGSYEYVSRKDSQVKIMGYRIELGEVEHALMSIDGVDDAAVVVTEEGDSGLRELVAYYESSSDYQPEMVMAGMKKLLPGYMLPKRLLKVSKIPRNERGKIDRGSLCNWGGEYSQLAVG